MAVHGFLLLVRRIFNPVKSWLLARSRFSTLTLLTLSLSNRLSLGGVILLFTIILSMRILSSRIDKACDSPGFKQNAVEVSYKIKQEGGVTKVIGLIEEHYEKVCR